MQGCCSNNTTPKQGGYTLLTKEGYEIRKTGVKEKAKITGVNTKKASEIFGQKTKTPDQPLIEITANVNGWEGRIGTIPKPPSKMVSPKSKMAKFLQRYKKAPEPGMAVDAVTNEKGYWTLVL
jgi:hypothetical protein